MATMKAEMHQKQILATMANRTSNEILCDRYYNWSGKPGPFPPPIPAGGQIKFTDFGNKGAVIYDGPNAACMPVSWLLAWDAPEISSLAPNKVYVTCGLKVVIDNLTENQIQKKLEEASDKSSHIDPISGTKVDATIKDLITIVPGGVAAINANFGLIN
ncbi:hypothetical protein RND81_10G054600 [Saponaria officinalis]|uniref:Uncharacterized protein n=1 Tax=Saponaria officinalis TaxID=3572 RepID=A0AAW1HZA3_SAPOF